jgi:phosphoglycerate dehydrogenase-like enzyme
MRVIGFRRNPAAGAGHADAVHALARFKALLPQADFVALTCPLTEETKNLMDAEAFAQMKPSAYLINTARGRCVDEGALTETMLARRIAGAAIDVTAEEPLSPTSRLWAMENVLITPHTAGETRRYEDNVLAIMQENLERLWRGERILRNEIV